MKPKICFFLPLLLFQINADLLAERLDNLTRQLSSPENSYEALYNEALQLYDDLKARKKKASVPEASPKPLLGSESKAPGDEGSDGKEESLQQELEEKGVKININLNGDGKRSPEKELENSLFVIQDLLRELIASKKESYSQLDLKSREMTEESRMQEKRFMSIENAKNKLFSQIEGIKGQKAMQGMNEEDSLKKKAISGIFDEIKEEISEIESTANSIDLPLSEYERSSKEFIAASNRKLSLEAENREIQKDIESLSQKQQEGDLLFSSLNKKFGFFNQSMKTLTEGIASKEEEKRQVFIGFFVWGVLRKPS